LYFSLLAFKKPMFYNNLIICGSSSLVERIVAND
jgi:hypothetical protein